MDNKRALSMIGLAQKAGKVASGEFSTEKAVKEHKAYMVIVADEEEKKAKIIVSEQQLSLAIGKSGQNVRLAAKLTGYGIDIKSEADPEAFADMDKDNAEIVYGEDSEGYNDNQADDVMPLDEDYNEDAASDTEVVEE